MMSSGLCQIGRGDYKFIIDSQRYTLEVLSLKTWVLTGQAGGHTFELHNGKCTVQCFLELDQY